MDYTRKPFGNFSLDKLNYIRSDKGDYIHNYDRDLHFVILWENGRSKDSEILNFIASQFKVLYCANIVWSEEKKIENFNRLYTQPLYSEKNIPKYKQKGLGPFLCIVFEDLNPSYQYIKSLSGEIFLGNKKVIDLKYDIRKLIGGNFAHGSSDILEFYHHASMIFDLEKLKQIIDINEWDKSIHEFRQDLAGSNGWESFHHLFKIVNYSSDWIVLRNHEFLPHNFWGNDKDIDLMCDNELNFISSVNGLHFKNNAYKVLVEGKEVILDIRYVGDNYYDPVWQYQMLERKELKENIVPIPRADDYFFSLLYHVKLQKYNVKQKYIEKLLELRKEIGFNEMEESDIVEDYNSALILNGYLNKNGYYYFSPHDKKVTQNKNVLKYLTAFPKKINNPNRKIFIRRLSRLTPNSIKQLVPRSFKRMILKR